MFIGMKYLLSDKIHPPPPKKKKQISYEKWWFQSHCVWSLISTYIYLFNNLHHIQWKFHLCSICAHLALVDSGHIYNWVNWKKNIQFKILKCICNCNIVFWWFWVQNLQQMQLGKNRSWHNKHVLSIWFILVYSSSFSPVECRPPPPSLRSSSPPPHPVWCSWCEPAWHWPPPVWLSSWIFQTLSKIRPSAKQSFCAHTEIFNLFRGKYVCYPSHL